MSSPSAPASENGEAYDAVTLFCKGSICERVKLFCSFIVVTLLILVVFTGISMQYCVLKVHPLLGFLISKSRLPPCAPSAPPRPLCRL